MSDLPNIKLTPVQTAIALLIKDIHRDDDAAVRAVNRLLTPPTLPPLISFDGVEAIFQSANEPELRNVTTAEGCSCRGGNRAWCVHRVRFRILMAESAIRDPLALLSAFVEHAPEDLRCPRPYAFPTPDASKAARSPMPEARLPDSLRPAPPIGRAAPIDPDLQREIDALFPN